MAGQCGRPVILDEARGGRRTSFYGGAHLCGACILFSGSDSPGCRGGSGTASRTEYLRDIHAKNTQSGFCLFRGPQVNGGVRISADTGQRRA